MKARASGDGHLTPLGVAWPLLRAFALGGLGYLLGAGAVALAGHTALSGEPSSAPSTANPADASARETKLRMRGSSSTTSTRAMVLMSVPHHAELIMTGLSWAVVHQRKPVRPASGEEGNAGMRGLALTDPAMTGYCE